METPYRPFLNGVLLDHPYLSCKDFVHKGAFHAPFLTFFLYVLCIDIHTRICIHKKLICSLPIKKIYMTSSSTKIKRGPVVVLFGTIFSLILGTFVLKNDKEIIAQFEREKLTPEEILLVAREQYQLEKADRLELLNRHDEQLCIATERIQQLASDLCVYKQQQIALQKQVASLRQTSVSQISSSAGGRGATYDPASDQVTNGTASGSISGNATTYYLELSLKNLAKSMNKANARQIASYRVDPSGKQNILYFDTKKKMFAYLYPVVQPETKKATEALPVEKKAKGTKKAQDVVTKPNASPKKIRG